MAMFDLSNIKKLIGGAPTPTAVGFQRVLNQNDFTFATTSTTSKYTAGNYDIIAKFQIPAQQAYTWGYGSSIQPDNQGYLYVSLKDTATTPAQVDGKIRFATSDANFLNTSIVAELRTDNLRGSTSLRTQMMPFPTQGQEMGFNNYLLVYLNADSGSGNGTLAQGNSSMLIPVTLRSSA